MIKKECIEKLSTLAKNVSLLYIEDNEGLRTQVKTLLGDFFEKLYIAKDGEEGLETFKKAKPQIVVTDLKMPKLNGLLVIQEIRKLSKDAIIIITSAHDNKDYLLTALNERVYKFIKKPLNAGVLLDTLVEALEETHPVKEENEIFSRYEKSFHSQGNMLVIIKDRKALVANERFLEFFKLDNVEQFNQKHPLFLDIFLMQKGFFAKDDRQATEQLFEGALRPVNAKIKRPSGKLCHMILSSHSIEEEGNEILVSLQDVSELGLLALFDMPMSEINDNQTQENVSQLLRLLFENKADFKLYNFYKGLPISHEAKINYLTEDEIGFKAHVQQLRAMIKEDQTVLTSELLPMDLLLRPIVSISLDQGEVLFKHGVFVPSSAVQRQYMRIEPDPDHKVTLLLKNSSIGYELRIKDISTKSICIRGGQISDSLKEGDILIVDMVFTMRKRPFIINSEVVVLSIKEVRTKNEKRGLKEVVFRFSENSAVLKKLNTYISNRQLEVIRDFKGDKNG